MRHDVFDPGLLASLSDFYPTTVVIQSVAASADAVGGLEETPTTLYTAKGHVSPYPRIQEADYGGANVHRATHRVALDGVYNAISADCHAVIGGVVYEIVEVRRDGMGGMCVIDVRVFE